jgi:hypothetical protein
MLGRSRGWDLDMSFGKAAVNPDFERSCGNDMLLSRRKDVGCKPSERGIVGLRTHGRMVGLCPECGYERTLLAVVLHPRVDDVLRRVRRTAFGIVPGADVLRVILVEGGLEIGV